MMKLSLLFLFLFPLLASCTQKQVYIVYLGGHKGDKALHEIEAHHNSYLNSVKESEEDAISSLLYSYKHAMNGFAAKLTPDEAEKLSKMEGVVSVFRSDPNKYVTHTTRSWEFAGLEEVTKLKFLKRDNLLLKSKYGSNIIVGILDSGIWPESKSFHDEGLGPIPKRWKGLCQSGDNFDPSKNCNKKVIGARIYIKGYEESYGPLNRTLDYLSPRDKDGHGTHTASTAVGRRVYGAAALGGFGKGTASGGAPLARLAVYKVCWAKPGQEKIAGNICFEEDMLAGIDDAVGDGVDLISISIGSFNPLSFGQDGIAIGAFHALSKNVVVAASAGNSGPAPETLSNPAPWIITVSASSVDRAFIGVLTLGNGESFEGQTITPYALKKKMYPLVYAADIEKSSVPRNESGQCLDGALSPEKAKGKIVMCTRGLGTRVEKGAEVKRAGGIGYVLGNNEAYGEDLVVDPHVLPATAISHKDALKVLHYINSTKNPTAYIAKAETVQRSRTAPTMASFTSRGPSVVSPDILKPDISAPGLNILASWSEGNSPTKLQSDHRVVKFNVESGTSMSCPHIAGTIALLKAVHPTWSNPAIRSAIMTTAGLLNNKGKLITDSLGNPADPFQYGSGHFRPSKAADPGLVYDASYEDYLLYLCSIGITGVDADYQCPENPPAPNNLNYPSVAIPKLNGSTTVTRTVTNVGGRRSIYFASVKPPLGYSVQISPPILFFKHVGQKKSFTITVKPNLESLDKIEKDKYEFGWFTWSDGIHNVRSPMAVKIASS